VGTQAKREKEKKRNGRVRRDNSAECTSVFETLLDSLDIGTAIVSTGGFIQYSSACFAELIGAPPFKEIKGDHLRAFVSPKSWTALDEALRRSVCASSAGKLLLENLKGRKRTVRVSFIPLIQPESELQIGIVATEITKLVESNTALKQSEAALQSVSVRLLQVQDEERRHLARDLHDTIGQELAVAVMQVEQMAKQVGLPEVDLRKPLMECSEWLRKIETETRTLSYVLHPPLLDQLGLVPALNWYIEGFSKRSGLKVQLDVASDIPRLEVEEETALFRIVQESLTNVLRHSGSSEALVRVSVEGDGLAVAVEDKGHGFGAQTPERHKPAIGVGLAGMRGRLSPVDGKLDVRSSKHGTTVRATVPFHKAEKGEEQAGGRRAVVTQPLAPTPMNPAAAESVARILIADDHEVARRGIRDLFRDEPDLEICGEARDGLEALAKVEELQPDLLILDLSMPKLGGLSVAHRLRSARQSVKILIYSTHAPADVERMARSIGCGGCVHKANAARDLVRGVRAILQGRAFYECDAGAESGDWEQSC
jgi:signal transduction histidine kinase